MHVRHADHVIGREVALRSQLPGTSHVPDRALLAGGVGETRQRFAAAPVPRSRIENSLEIKMRWPRG
jgi:hypothetical protein